MYAEGYRKSYDVKNCISVENNLLGSVNMFSKILENRVNES